MKDPSSGIVILILAIISLCLAFTLFGISGIGR